LFSGRGLIGGLLFIYLIYVRLNKDIGALDFEFGCYRNFILYTIIILHLLFEYIIFTV
jgi:hypothetical protein